MTQTRQKNERCFFCGKNISGDEVWPLYYVEICVECVYKYCVQCEVCGELALSSDPGLIRVEAGDEDSYYHRTCFERKQLLDSLRERIKRY